MNYSSVLRVLLLSLPHPSFECNFCSRTIVSVPVIEFQKETSELNHCFEEKALPAEGARQGSTEASCYTLSVPKWPSD